jgi:hypothetical protein
LEEWKGQRAARETSDDKQEGMGWGVVAADIS